jgi:hypothetical protein
VSGVIPATAKRGNLPGIRNVMLTYPPSDAWGNVAHAQTLTEGKHHEQHWILVRLGTAFTASAESWMPDQATAAVNR